MLCAKNTKSTDCRLYLAPQRRFQPPRVFRTEKMQQEDPSAKRRKLQPRSIGSPSVKALSYDSDSGSAVNQASFKVPGREYGGAGAGCTSAPCELQSMQNHNRSSVAAIAAASSMQDVLL